MAADSFTDAPDPSAATITMPQAQGDGGAPRINRIVVFTTIAFALMMMSIDSTIVATVLHALQNSLNTSVNWAGWTLTAYSLGFLIMLPISGRLGDNYGRRRVFVASVIVFTISSLLCGFAKNISTLIILRAVQAIGGAGFTPAATGIIVEYFGSSRDRAVGLFGSIFPIGAMLGPIFGGMFLKWLTWRWAFFINVPIGILILILTFIFIPADHRAADHASRKLDFPGMALMGLAVLLTMFAASSIAEPGITLSSPLFYLPALGGLIIFFLFARHIRHSAHPFIPPHLILGRGFGAVNLINMLFGGMILGAVSLIPIYAIERYDIEPFRAGTLLIAQGIAAILFSLLGIVLLRRGGHRLPILIGGITCILGLMVLSLSPQLGMSPWAWLALGAFIIGCGIGGANPASRNAGLQLAPEQSGTQAALRSLFMQAGTIIIISVITSLLAAAKEPSVIHAHAYLALGVALLPALALVLDVPEHYGSW